MQGFHRQARSREGEQERGEERPEQARAAVDVAPWQGQEPGHDPHTAEQAGRYA